MKIRTGFVSNSSSASFVITAFKVESFDEIKTDNVYEYDLKEGQTRCESGFNGAEVCVKGPGKFVIVSSYSDEECDEDGDCDFTEENHTEIFELMSLHNSKIVDSCTGYGRDG